MPDNALPQLSPAILRQAQDAASTVLAAGQAPRPQFTLVYLAVPGCGDMHNYANLRTADALPNVTLRHVNVFNPSQPFNGAPGAVLRFTNVGAVINTFQRFGMDITEANKVLLLDAQNRPVREFPSSNNKNGFDFNAEIRRATGNAPAPHQRGAARG